MVIQDFGGDLPSRERLRMRGVRKRFGATVALAGVDLCVKAGEVLALVGENGAGKSTLMKILSGAHQADGGEMFLDGAAYRPRDPLEARRAGVAMIYQELAQAPHLSVMENILLGAEPTIGPVIDWREVRRRAGEALRSWDGRRFRWMRRWEGCRWRSGSWWRWRGRLRWGAGCLCWMSRPAA